MATNTVKLHKFTQKSNNKLRINDDSNFSIEISRLCIVYCQRNKIYIFVAPNHPLTSHSLSLCGDVSFSTSKMSYLSLSLLVCVCVCGIAKSKKFCKLSTNYRCSCFCPDSIWVQITLTQSICIKCIRLQSNSIEFIRFMMNFFRF